MQDNRYRLFHVVYSEARKYRLLEGILREKNDIKLFFENQLDVYLQDTCPTVFLWQRLTIERFLIIMINSVENKYKTSISEWNKYEESGRIKKTAETD